MAMEARLRPDAWRHAWCACMTRRHTRPPNPLKISFKIIDSLDISLVSWVGVGGGGASRPDGTRGPPTRERHLSGELTLWTSLAPLDCVSCNPSRARWTARGQASRMTAVRADGQAAITDCRFPTCPCAAGPCAACPCAACGS
jgi:hypothetical protein